MWESGMEMKFEMFENLILRGWNFLRNFLFLNIFKCFHNLTIKTNHLKIWNIVRVREWSLLTHSLLFFRLCAFYIIAHHLPFPSPSRLAFLCMCCACMPFVLCCNPVGLSSTESIYSHSSFLPFCDQKCILFIRIFLSRLYLGFHILGPRNGVAFRKKTF